MGCKKGKKEGVKKAPVGSANVGMTPTTQEGAEKVRCQRKKHPHHHFHVGERSHFVLTVAAAHGLNSKNPALPS